MYTICCSTTARKRSSRHLFLKCRKYVIRTLCLRSICMAINDNQLASIISDCSRLLWCHTQVFPIAFETKTGTSLGGLEPPTFWLTAERANRLCHVDLHISLCSLKTRILIFWWTCQLKSIHVRVPGWLCIPKEGFLGRKECEIINTGHAKFTPKNGKLSGWFVRSLQTFAISSPIWSSG